MTKYYNIQDLPVELQQPALDVYNKDKFFKDKRYSLEDIKKGAISFKVENHSVTSVRDNWILNKYFN